MNTNSLSGKNKKDVDVKKCFTPDHNPEHYKFEDGYVIKEHMDMVREVLGDSENDRLNTYNIANICDQIKLYEGQQVTKEQVLERIDEHLGKLFSSLTLTLDMPSGVITFLNPYLNQFMCSLLGWTHFCLLLSSIEKRQRVLLVATKNNEGKRVYSLELAE